MGRTEEGPGGWEGSGKVGGGRVWEALVQRLERQGSGAIEMLDVGGWSAWGSAVREGWNWRQDYRGGARAEGQCTPLPSGSDGTRLVMVGHLGRKCLNECQMSGPDTRGAAHEGKAGSGERRSKTWF